MAIKRLVRGTLPASLNCAMTKTTKPTIQWTKLPSVTREGRYFYRATLGSVVATVSQSWLSGLWNYETNREPQTGTGEYRTSREAQAAAEARHTT